MHLHECEQLTAIALQKGAGELGKERRERREEREEAKKVQERSLARSLPLRSLRERKTVHLVETTFSSTTSSRARVEVDNCCSLTSLALPRSLALSLSLPVNHPSSAKRRRLCYSSLSTPPPQLKACPRRRPRRPPFSSGRRAATVSSKTNLGSAMAFPTPPPPKRRRLLRSIAWYVRFGEEGSACGASKGEKHASWSASKAGAPPLLQIIAPLSLDFEKKNQRQPQPDDDDAAAAAAKASAWAAGVPSRSAALLS